MAPVVKAAPSESPRPDGIGRKEKADRMYNECIKQPASTVFYQRDFVGMDIASNTTDLLGILQELVDTHRLKTMTWEGQACWAVRPREEADRLRNMTGDERHIYALIDEVQNNGIWIRALRSKSGLNQQVLAKILKGLENKGLIKMVMNVKYNARKMYLLAHLEPSPEIAGGPWQTNGEWDQALIETISKVVVKCLRHETWIDVPAYPRNPDRNAAIAHKKAQVQRGTPDIEDLAVQRPRTTPVPRADRTNYPTTTFILNFINKQQLIRGKIITEPDIEQLLEMLVLDGRVENVGFKTYKSTKDGKDNEFDREGPWNGFVDAPCGTCPVFDMCGDEGEITARTCRYFAEWLGTTSA